MFDNVPKEAYWTLPLIIAILGYFLRDAHSKINAAIDKHGLELSKKLDEDRYNAAKAESKLEIEALKRDSKEAHAKLEEKQERDRKFLYEQLTEKITTTETHLAGKIDDLMKFITQKKP